MGDIRQEMTPLLDLSHNMHGNSLSLIEEAKKAGHPHPERATRMEINMLHLFRTNQRETPSPSQAQAILDRLMDRNCS